MYDYAKKKKKLFKLKAFDIAMSSFTSVYSQ